MEDILKKNKELKIAVIGDIMLDHYVWGDTHRISPEAPVPVIHVEKDSYVPGGAANVALNVSCLGGKVKLIGSASNDDAGAELMSKLNANIVSFDSRFARSEAATIVKTRLMVRGQQLCRIDREADPSEYSMDDEETGFILEEKLKDVHAVLLSDYAKGVISEALIRKVQEIVKGRGVFISMDPKPLREITYEGVDLLTPNRIEALQMAGLPIDPHRKFPAEKVCQVLWDKYKARNIVITLGADGMVISREGEAIKFVPTAAQEVYDVSGAGDTVIASLTLALAGGSSLEEAAMFANVAAGVVVKKVGTATVTPEEILAYEHNETFSIAQ